VFKPKGDNFWAAIRRDRSKEGEAIFRAIEKQSRNKNIKLDVSSISRAERLNRMEIIKVLNNLEFKGLLELRGSGVDSRYRVLKRLPASSIEVGNLARKLYVDLQARENQALYRALQVENLITGDQCYAHALAQHFGMGLPDGKQRCGHCSFCRTNTRLVLLSKPVLELKASSIENVLAATDIRDDPRFLARVAFGIKSPRVTKEGLDKVPAFMSLAHYDFNVS
jgi:hypothetical protein